MDEFKLSTVLYGHSLDVRSLAITSDNSIVSGSRDKTAKLWRNNGFNTGYTEVMTYRDQKNFVASVLYIDPTDSYPDGLVITGGNDNMILVYKPSEPFAALTLKEHSNVVCCLAKGKEQNSFLSASWDTTAKYWNLDRPQSSGTTFSGHTAAVWNVLQRNDGNIVTASADKTIRVWAKDGQQINVLQGHTDCVRGLEDFPELACFVSVSNDASIKTWSYAGENLTTYYGHTNYIYSIARCKAGGENCFVTSDEDYAIRFWNNGINTQVIKLPAQSVWCVACLNNGDIVAGSSDGVIRIFTRDPQRVADQTALDKFNEEVQAILMQSTQEIGGVKVSDLPGKESLFEPGKKAGQMKMVREPQGVVAYTWVESGESSHWEKVGEVLGGTDKDDSGKTAYEGKSYDFVFSVDVEDGKPPLKLPYNKGDDPYMTAHKFLEKNMLPAEYLEQVVDFILKNSKTELPPVSNEYVDPFTGGARYTPSSTSSSQNFAGSNADPFTGGSSYSTGIGKNSSSGGDSGKNIVQSTGFFPFTTYRTFEMGDPNVILSKLIEFSKKSTAGNNVDENSLQELIKICTGPPTDANAFDTLFRLLEWPDDIIFPVLDVIRLAVRNKKNNQVLTSMNNGILLEKLKSYVSENCRIINNLIVSLRTLVNLFCHEEGEHLILEHRFDILENITSLSSLNKNAEVALATLLLNMSIGVMKQNDDLGVSVLAEVIPDIFSKLNDAEAQFRGYVALGNLLSSTVPGQVQEVKLKIKENSIFICKLEQHILSGQSELEIKRMNCARQVQDILNR